MKGLRGADLSDLPRQSRFCQFKLPGETSGGLTFGGELRADHAPDAALGIEGEVFMAGDAWRLSMGVVGGVVEASVGFLSPVGLTEL